MRRKSRKIRPEPSRIELDKLASLKSNDEPKIRYYSKSRSVTIRDNLEGISCTFTVPQKDLADALDSIANLDPSASTALINRLFNALFEAMILHGGPRKAKGIQAKPGLTAFLATVKYASAWTYCFVRHERRKTRDRYLPIQNVDIELKKKVQNWSSYPESEKIILFTAFLVTTAPAYEEKWKKFKLKNPLDDPDEYRSEPFYRTYILPRYQQISKIISRHPKLLSFPSNPYLRAVLDRFLSPASTTTENR